MDLTLDSFYSTSTEILYITSIAWILKAFFRNNNIFINDLTSLPSPRNTILYNYTDRTKVIRLRSENSYLGQTVRPSFRLLL